MENCLTFSVLLRKYKYCKELCKHQNMPVEHLQNIIIVKLKLWLPNGSYSTFFPYTSIFALILKKSESCLKYASFLDFVCLFSRQGSFGDNYEQCQFLILEYNLESKDIHLTESIHPSVSAVISLKDLPVVLAHYNSSKYFECHNSLDYHYKPIQPRQQMNLAHCFFS